MSQSSLTKKKGVISEKDWDRALKICLKVDEKRADAKRKCEIEATLAVSKIDSDFLCEWTNYPKQLNKNTKRIEQRFGRRTGESITKGVEGLFGVSVREVDKKCTLDTIMDYRNITVL